MGEKRVLLSPSPKIGSSLPIGWYSSGSSFQTALRVSNAVPIEPEVFS